MHSEVVFLGIDELACRAGLPHPVLQIAQQLLSAVGGMNGKHDVCIGAAIFSSITFRLHYSGSSICHCHEPCLRCCRERCFASVLLRFWHATALQDNILAKQLHISIRCESN